MTISMQKRPKRYLLVPNLMKQTSLLCVSLLWFADCLFIYEITRTFIKRYFVMECYYTDLPAGGQILYIYEL